MSTKRMRLTIMAAVLAGILAVSAAGPAQARIPQADWSGRLYPLRTDAGLGEQLVDFDDVIEGSAAAYRNGGNGVSFEVHGRQLQHGHAYTVWVMAFNHPQHCVGGPITQKVASLRCGQDDHFNPATGFSIMYGTGAWAEGNSITFHGDRPANSVLDIPPDVVHGIGLVNPQGAEIHLRIRDHGPAQEGLEDDQISSFAGGCTEESAPAFFGAREDAQRGDYPCRDIHATAS